MACGVWLGVRQCPSKPLPPVSAAAPPVSFAAPATDVLIVFLTVLAVGLIAVWLPVRRMTRNLLTQQ